MPPIVTTVPAGSAPTSRALQLRDWTGGLNLRDDAYQLQPNETSDCLDVDISAQGGFSRRGTIRTITDDSPLNTASDRPWLLAQFNGEGQSQIVVGGATGGLLSADSFNRADSAVTLGSTNGAGSLDPIAWVADHGTWGIFTNQATYESIGGAAARGIATIDTLVSDVDISLKLVTVGDSGICFRFVDVDNYWAAYADGSDLLLVKREAGVSTQVGIYTSAITSTNQTLRVVALGEDIRCYVQNLLKISTSSAFGVNANKHGLFMHDTSSALIDNWSIRSLGADTDALFIIQGLGDTVIDTIPLTGGPVDAPWAAAEMSKVTDDSSERLYIQRNAEEAVVKWGGVTATDLGDADGNYNEDIAAPAGGYAPIAKTIATHLAYLFHGYIDEGGDIHRNRIRWSHPGQPEDYRENDFIDVGEGQDSDSITALASFQGALFIFKNRSTWLLTGFDADTFALHKIAEVGAVSHVAVGVSSYGLVAFDARLGVHAYVQHGANGWSAEPLWNKLNVKLIDGTIHDTLVDDVTLAWLGARVYVSVPWGVSSAANTRTFVFDPFAGKGAWYAYGRGFYLLLEYFPPVGPSAKLGAETTEPTFIHQLDAGVTTDSYDGVVEVEYDAFLMTGWLDAGDPALKKRWRRFSMTFDAQRMSDSMYARVWKNWSTKGAARFYELQGTAAAGGMVWGDDWGDNWSAALELDQNTVRGGTIGTAYAVSAKVSGPTDKAWGCNALVFRYIPQRII